MQNDKNFLGTAPIGKLLLKLSIPTVIAQLINMLYNVVDRIYIGHIPGEGSLALTGVGVCMPIIMIVTAFAALISSGGAPRASICMGKQDNKSAEQILGNCFSLQIVVSIVLTVVLLIWNKDLLMVFGASKNTLGYATDYMRIYALGTLFVQLTLGMNAFITAQGFTTTSMVSVLIGAICNITLDPVFIFVFNMGVKGAALATVLSQAISTIWVVVFLSGKKTQLHLRKKYMGLKPKVFLPCVALGLATFIMQASESVVTVCFNSSLLHYGGDIAVGAMTILTSVMQFAMLPLQGIAQGSQPIASYNYGAKNADRVKKTFRLLVITCLTYSTLLWAAVQIIPKVFVSIFTSDAKLVAFTAPMLKIYLGGLFLFGIQIACQITFTSLGKAVNSIIVAVVRKFVLLLPLIYIMPHVVSNPTIGVYMAEPIADIIAVLFTSVLFTFQFKKALAQIRNSNKM
ncbi:MATE family efflux transporter [Eubacterium ventriosum]|jgi:putative MATE family efflux protein|uniref:Multidrug export protein MepA n=1 Tax=Eubacterium ventriosum TaxID=39496 RepID=A0A414R7C7_9FIRM|nr:MATE family efflux transporter [Eubacterium ventriosum]MBD9055014.1 MATE family efflux transporter [Eubacterium ventriosum]MEE0853831.1 MATE family efflux transporter [Eubacterium ventriosum]RHF88888.1 MATE family efflux transporter [Eubacterium ventriosum]